MFLINKNKKLKFRLFGLKSLAFVLIIVTCSCHKQLWIKPAQLNEVNKSSKATDKKNSKKRDSNVIELQSQLIPKDLVSKAADLFINESYQVVSFDKIIIKELSAVDFNGQPRVLIITADDHLLLCKLNSNRCFKTNVSDLKINHLAYSSASNSLALVSRQNYVLIYDLKHALLKTTSDKIRESISTLSFDNLGEQILIGTLPGKIYHWHFSDAKNRQALFSEYTRYGGHATIVKKLFMHSSNRVFFSVDWHGKISAWLTYESEPYRYDNVENPFSAGFWSELAERVKKQLPAQVNDVLLRSDGKYMLIALKDGKLSIWSVRGFEKICNLEGDYNIKQLFGNTDWSKALAYSKSSTFLFDLSGTIKKPDNYLKNLDCSIEVEDINNFENDIKQLFFYKERIYKVTSEGIYKVNQ